MAYRKLLDGDLVRVVDINSSLHGLDVVVIDANKDYARVQFNDDGTRCFDIPNRNLLVRDSAYHFIVDGRIDHEAIRKHDDEIRSKYLQRNMVDDEEECEYDSFSRLDLIEKLKELQGTVDYYEGL